MRSKNASFYKRLNMQLSTLAQTGTISIDFNGTMCLDEIKALSFRLLRKGRVDQIRNVKITQCRFGAPPNGNGNGNDDDQNSHRNACFEVLQTFLGQLRNLEDLRLGVGILQTASEYHGVSPTTTQLFRSCDPKKLAVLAIDIWNLDYSCSSSSSSSPPSSSILLRNQMQQPTAAEALHTLTVLELNRHKVGDFVRALSWMPRLKSMTLGLGKGTTDHDLNALITGLRNKIGDRLGLLILCPSPFAAGSLRLTSESLRSLNELLAHGGVLRNLVLRDLPELFSDPHCATFVNFLNVLRTSQSLRSLKLEGSTTGSVSPNTVEAIFRSIGRNQSITHMCVGGLRHPSSHPMWNSVLRSLSSNTNLQKLAFFTGSTKLDPETKSLILQGLRRNAGILWFECSASATAASSSNAEHKDLDLFCPRTHDQLQNISRRNICLLLTKQIVPGPSYPLQILPRALYYVANIMGGGPTTKFALLQNFAPALANHFYSCSNRRRPFHPRATWLSSKVTCTTSTNTTATTTTDQFRGKRRRPSTTTAAFAATVSHQMAQHQDHRSKKQHDRRSKKQRQSSLCGDDDTATTSAAAKNSTGATPLSLQDLVTLVSRELGRSKEHNGPIVPPPKQQQPQQAE